MINRLHNPFVADGWNVWICTVGLVIFVNSSVESYSMDRSDVNDTADRLISWTCLLG